MDSVQRVEMDASPLRHCRIGDRRVMSGQNPTRRYGAGPRAGFLADILENILLLPDPPVLIVTSPADEYLWAEALNVGAYDVLVKPFDASEVVRVLDSAWGHWTDLHFHNQVRHPQLRAATGVA